MKKLQVTVRAAVQRLRYAEPAMLRARVVAVLGVLVGAGVTIPGVVDRWVGIVFTVLAIAAPWYQGRRTRADVWSPATVDDLTALVAAFPGLAGKARELLGRGLGATVVREMLEQLAATAPATAPSPPSDPPTVLPADTSPGAEA